MENRDLAGMKVPEIGLGCWQSGGGWKNTWDDDSAQKIFNQAYDLGVRFFDTADVYGNGESEKSLGTFRKKHQDIIIATKMGRAKMYPDSYSLSGMIQAAEASQSRLGMSSLDLVQLHCVPTEILKEGEVFSWFERLKTEGLIKRYGASVETINEAEYCLEQDGIDSIQIIFNVLRQRPAEQLLDRAAHRGVGVIVRLPLASGLLSGKIKKDHIFDAGDHRHFNRNGEQFNVGETFAGLELNKGVDLSIQAESLLEGTGTFAQRSLRWILDHEAVSVVIPGASRPDQVVDNVTAASLPSFSADRHKQIRDWYESSVDKHIRGPY